MSIRIPDPVDTGTSIFFFSITFSQLVVEYSRGAAADTDLIGNLRHCHAGQA